MSIKQKALDKMLKEMNKKHTNMEDIIHNYLCDQEEEKLFEGILKDGRTIRGAMQYCSSQAHKQKVGNAAMVDDDTVYGWIWKYFTDEKIPKNLNQVNATVTTLGEKPKRKVRKKKEVSNMEGEQLDLLSFI